MRCRRHKNIHCKADNKVKKHNEKLYLQNPLWSHFLKLPRSTECARGSTCSASKMTRSMSEKNQLTMQTRAQNSSVHKRKPSIKLGASIYEINETSSQPRDVATVREICPEDYIILLVFFQSTIYLLQSAKLINKQDRDRPVLESENTIMRNALFYQRLAFDTRLNT